MADTALVYMRRLLTLMRIARALSRGKKSRYIPISELYELAQ